MFVKFGILTIVLNYSTVPSNEFTGRHFTGGAEKICPENNFFSLFGMGPETSCKFVLCS